MNRRMSDVLMVFCMHRDELLTDYGAPQSCHGEE